MDLGFLTACVARLGQEPLLAGPLLAGPLLAGPLLAGPLLAEPLPGRSEHDLARPGQAGADADADAARMAGQLMALGRRGRRPAGRSRAVYPIDRLSATVKS